jgi:hypothetical protein
MGGKQYAQVTIDVNGVFFVELHVCYDFFKK